MNFMGILAQMKRAMLILLVSAKYSIQIIGHRIIKYRLQLLASIGIIFVVTWFVVWFVTTESTIYFWDNSAYWMKTQGLADWINISLESAVRGVLHSMRYDEYNLLFAAPLSIITIIFGGSRLVYIVSILFLYFFPATIILGLIIQNITKKIWPKFIPASWIFIITWALIVFNPFVILPVLTGYSDIVGLIPLGLSILLYMKIRKNPRVFPLFIIGILLLMATLLRRWYIFGSVGLIIGILIDQVLLTRPPINYKITLLKFLKLATLPITYIGTFLWVAYPYISQLIATDYVEKYAAYRFHDNYFDLLSMVIARYGTLLMIICALGIVGLLATKKIDRRLVIMLLVSHLFSFFAVGRIQSFDTHQYYLLTLGVLLGLVAAPLVIHLCVKARYKKLLFGLTFSLVISVYLVTSWIMYFHPAPLKGFTNIFAAPLVREDINELKKIYSDTETAADAFTGNEVVYVLACSFVFNVDIFRNIPLSTGSISDKISNNEFSPTAIFDVAQGFDKGFFDAGIIIDSTPVGYITTHHGEQQIIKILHDELGVGGILQPYYESVGGAYTLENGYKANIYRRTNEIPAQVKDDIIQQVKSTHENISIID